MTDLAKFRRHVHLAARILDTPEGRNAKWRTVERRHVGLYV